MHSSPCFTANECLPHAPKSLSSTVAESTYIHGANRYMQRSSPTGNKCKAAPIKNNIISSKLEISNYHMSSESDAAIESESQDEDEKEEFEEGGWEDEGDKEDSVPSSPKDGGMFRRIESMSNLASRRSLLTTAFRDGDRAKALQDKAPCSKSAIRRSRTTTPNGPSTGNSRMRKGLVTRQATRSIPITKTISNNMHPPVMSPRTTRRLMLQRELTSSLRQSLLWERQQKNATTNAVTKRQQSAVSLPALCRAASTNNLPTSDPDPHPAQDKVAPFMDDARFNSLICNLHSVGTDDYHVVGW